MGNSQELAQCSFLRQQQKQCWRKVATCRSYPAGDNLQYSWGQLHELANTLRWKSVGLVSVVCVAWILQKTLFFHGNIECTLHPVELFQYLLAGNTIHTRAVHARPGSHKDRVVRDVEREIASFRIRSSCTFAPGDTSNQYSMEDQNQQQGLGACDKFGGESGRIVSNISVRSSQDSMNCYTTEQIPQPIGLTIAQSALIFANLDAVESNGIGWWFERQAMVDSLAHVGIGVDASVGING
mmetsp:Transcript_610/g.1466  ORF Transcript_610/g.1466 Transcript_610/m.1466 type:complete len:240 (+) Transcript_610:280-999(+)